MYYFVLVDAELLELKSGLRLSKRAAFAKGTSKNLNIQWRAFLLFCIYFDLQWLPTNVDVLCLYAQFLSKTFKATSSINNYISGVKLFHILLDTPCPAFGNIELKMAVRGIGRLNPHCPRQASPIDPHILLKINSKLDLSNPIHATFWGLFLTAFFTWSRKSNLVVTGSDKFDPDKQLCRHDIIMGSNGVLVQFRWTKTIQFGQRVLKVPLVAIPGSPLCPLVALRNMIRLVPGSGEDPAFMIKEHGLPIPISYAALQKFIKACIASVGLEPESFSSHSFRRGGATWAFRSDVPADLIKVHGDWASQAYMRYLDFSLDQRLEVATRMVDRIVKGELVH